MRHFHRYGHGHSAALGFLLALALSRHGLLFALLSGGAGFAAGRAWATITGALRGLAERRVVKPRARRIGPQP